jgi:hippurate hydrolase
MTSEDFGFFTQKYPSCFYRFGIKGDSNQDTGGLHSANFKVDLNALKIGTGGLAWLAWKFITDND